MDNDAGAATAPERTVVQDGIWTTVHTDEACMVAVRLFGDHVIAGIHTERMGDLTDGSPYFAHYRHASVRIIPKQRPWWRRLWEAYQ